MNKMTTRGGIVIEDIKVGDIHYEYDYGFEIECKVLTLPVKTEDEDTGICYSWESINTLSKNIIKYNICTKYSHYGPKLYDYKAYTVCKRI